MLFRSNKTERTQEEISTTFKRYRLFGGDVSSGQYSPINIFVKFGTCSGEKLIFRVNTALRLHTRPLSGVGPVSVKT